MQIIGRATHSYQMDWDALIKRLSKIADDLNPTSDANLDAILLAMDAATGNITTRKVAFALLSSIKVMPPLDQLTGSDRARARDGGT